MFTEDQKQRVARVAIKIFSSKEKDVIGAFVRESGVPEAYVRDILTDFGVVGVQPHQAMTVTPDVLNHIKAYVQTHMTPNTSSGGGILDDLLKVIEGFDAGSLNAQAKWDALKSAVIEASKTGSFRKR